MTSEICRRKDSKAFVFHSVMRILLKLTQLKDDADFATDLKSMLCSETLFSNSDRFHEAEKNIEKSALETDERSNKITEIKTHALNILRALYKHCQLGDLVQEYVSEGLIAAIKSYDGKSWAVRD